MTKNTLYERMRESGMRYKEISIGEKISAVVMERGGRVLGIFQEGKGENLLWTNPLLDNEESAGEMLKGNMWNTGGDRLWVGPEIRYSVSDRRRFWETLHTPESIDPGSYTLEERDGDCILRQRLCISEKDGGCGKAMLEVERHIRECKNPLRESEAFEEIMEGVEYAGYEQILDLSGEGTSVEGWNLLQVNSGGCVYIPMYYPCRGTDYYEPARKFETLLSNAVMLKATGSDRYKVGYKAAYVTGRIGYACIWNGVPCLIIRNFPNDPSGLYEEEPPLDQGNKGFSIHIYNDNGNPPSFTELECNLPAIMGSQRKKCSEIISTWIFCGNKVQLQEIGKRLLGIGDLKFGCNE